MGNHPIYAHDKNLSASDLPNRPPSVNLPSIGQEGNEYANFDTPTDEQPPSLAAERTANVSADLPMHAPKASVPQSTATSRISTVTRTDSSQAAAAGIGKAQSEDEKEAAAHHPLRMKTSFNQSNHSLGRPSSVHEGEHEHGIPSFGLQVPMYPNAGDVQAPTPTLSAGPHAPGIGFFNDGSQAPSSRNHHRRRSSRHQFNPPDSYGMHGFAHEPKDQFEREWYKKHPEALAKEIHREYDPGHPRGEWALSSEDLNKLVHASTDRGNGAGN